MQATFHASLPGTHRTADRKLPQLYCKKGGFCYLITVIIQAALYVEYQALSTGRCMYIVCCAWTKLITWCNEWSHTCSCGGRLDMGCVRSYMHTHTHTHTHTHRERERDQQIAQICLVLQHTQGHKKPTQAVGQALEGVKCVH